MSQRVWRADRAVQADDRRHIKAVLNLAFALLVLDVLIRVTGDGGKPARHELPTRVPEPIGVALGDTPQ